ncbi:unnamed protein product [Clonostachys rosea f. rosea IK726]|uniref:Uncharacterized protein n=2 Tax=Bionectria ochroleuca TaxID=29856 RepID=A0A0B7JW63_BIOOC|nr:unnamed protein product [Clonostachys rosea f. rosea IK726]
MGAEEEQGGALQTAKDLFAGAMGGIVQVLVGQPFDIVKVRLQTTSQYKSAVDAATSIYRNEGALAFYKGTLTPLVGIGACVSHVRIRLQSQPHGAARLYDGPLDCIRKLGAHKGVLSGIYRGEVVTIWREAFAYGAWFAAFEYMMNKDAARNKIDRKDIPAYKVAFYGGLAGEALWLASYPFDVVKSKMQTDGFGAEQKYPTMRSCFASTWKADGIRGFWKGIGPTLLRAMPVSACTFATVEFTMRLIN